MGRGLAGSLALVLVLLFAAPASAGVADGQVGEFIDICAAQHRLTYTDVRSERNTVVIANAQTRDLNPHIFPPVGPSPCVTLGGIAVVDLEAAVIARGACDPFTGRGALCPYPVVAPFDAPHQMVVDVGAFNDSVRVDAVPHQVSVQLGAGSDNGRVLNGKADAIACGPGVDQVIADAVDTVAADCEDVIRL